MNTAIAHHLNVTESAIIRVEEWANVIFTVVRGIGARFVSKKVVKMETNQLPSLQGSEKQIAWAENIRNEFTSKEKQDNGIFDVGAAGWVFRVANPEAIEVYTQVLTITDSSWWIENRNALNATTFKSAYKRIGREIN